MRWYLYSRAIKMLHCLKEGWTREEIAEEMHVSLRTIYNWERGMREDYGTKTTIGTICKLCMEGRLGEKPKKYEIPEDLRRLNEYWDSIGYGVPPKIIKNERPPERIPEKSREEFHYTSIYELLHEFDAFTEEDWQNMSFDEMIDKIHGNTDETDNDQSAQNQW